MNRFSEPVFLLRSVAIYQDLLSDPAVESLLYLLGEEQSPEQVAYHYARFYRVIAESPFRANLSDYLFAKLLAADNLFTRECAKNNYLSIPLWIKEAVQNELTAFGVLASVTVEELKSHLTGVLPSYADVISLLPKFRSKNSRYSPAGNWGDDLAKLAEFYRSNGCGIFAKANLFHLCPDASGYPLIPILRSVDGRMGKEACPLRSVLPLQEEFSHSLEQGDLSPLFLFAPDSLPLFEAVKRAGEQLAAKGLRIIKANFTKPDHIVSALPRLGEAPVTFLLYLEGAAGIPNFAEQLELLENRQCDNIRFCFPLGEADQALPLPFSSWGKVLVLTE